ncbi:hypothetical protein EXN66_Car014601 [Channa argus]|uniref:Uncharacterized protein n=1 Tax=Channa argus TaxID=215402 RepID=A0A6G1Q924_CHAAH|nr:hypothetical protein EXN66_Car014601 [Channa argus]
MQVTTDKTMGEGLCDEEEKVAPWRKCPASASSMFIVCPWEMCPFLSMRKGTRVAPYEQPSGGNLSSRINKRASKDQSAGFYIFTKNKVKGPTSNRFPPVSTLKLSQPALVSSVTGELANAPPARVTCFNRNWPVRGSKSRLSHLDIRVAVPALAALNREELKVCAENGEISGDILLVCLAQNATDTIKVIQHVDDVVKKPARSDEQQELALPVQCETDPTGRNGRVVYDTLDYPVNFSSSWHRDQASSLDSSTSRRLWQQSSDEIRQQREIPAFVFYGPVYDGVHHAQLTRCPLCLRETSNRMTQKQPKLRLVRAQGISCLCGKLETGRMSYHSQQLATLRAAILISNQLEQLKLIKLGQTRDTAGHSGTHYSLTLRGSDQPD